MKGFVDYKNKMFVQYMFDEDGVWVLFDTFTELLGIGESKIKSRMEKRGFILEKKIFEFEQENRYGEYSIIRKSFIPALNAYQIISIWKNELSTLEMTIIQLEEKYEQLKSSSNTLSNKHKADLSTLFNEINEPDFCIERIREIANELSNDPFINNLMNNKVSYNLDENKNLFTEDVPDFEFKHRIYCAGELDEIELLTRIAYPDDEF